VRIRLPDRAVDQDHVAALSGTPHVPDLLVEAVREPHRHARVEAIELAVADEGADLQRVGVVVDLRPRATSPSQYLADHLAGVDDAQLVERRRAGVDLVGGDASIGGAVFVADLLDRRLVVPRAGTGVVVHGERRQVRDRVRLRSGQRCGGFERDDPDHDQRQGRDRGRRQPAGAAAPVSCLLGPVGHVDARPRARDTR
jgi:hypothetical protein